MTFRVTAAGRLSQVGLVGGGVNRSVGCGCLARRLRRISISLGLGGSPLIFYHARFRGRDRQQLPYVSQTFHADRRGAREPQREAESRIEHPEREVARPMAVVRLQATPQEGLATLGDRLDDVDRLAIPGVPGVTHPPQVGIVGFV